MKRLSMDTLSDTASRERVHNPRKSSGLTHTQERKLRRYRGADRSVTLGGVIAPPTKNAAKSAFGQDRPRLDTSIVIPSKGNGVIIPSKLGC